MKKIMVFVITCLILTGWQIVGYCEGESEAGSMGDSGIEQSESAVESSLGAEISADQAQSEGEISQMDESVDSGGMSN